MNLVGLLPIKSGAIFRQIADTLEIHIRRHGRDGDPLPTEAALAMQFGVNKHTLRRAIDELERSGLVERRRGIGLFVLDPTISYRIEETTRFTAKMEELGKSAATQVLQKQIILADYGVAEQLALEVGQEIVAIQTLRLVDDRPFCVISHFLPADPFCLLAESYTEGSLHAIIERDFGRKLKRSQSLVTSILPQAKDAALLRISRTEPILRVKSLNRDAASGVPLELSLTRFRGDRVELAVDL